jgi:hypothetical protein
VAEFETNLRWLSERGNPVGAEELIERIEAELAGDPLVVVNKRREGTIMTKTQQAPATGQPSRNRGPAWALAAFVIVLAVGGLYLAFADDSGVVADNPPPPTLAPDVETTTENGPDEFFNGEVTFDRPGGWRYSWARWDFTPTMETLILANLNERVALVADPLPVETGCEVGPGPAPVDAEALAQSIRTDPDLEVSEPVAVSVGGIEGMRMDVVAAPGASNCDYEGWPAVLAASTGTNDEGHQLVEMPVGSRMRLYLLDLPEGISAGILAIVIAAPESRFDQVVEKAAPIVDSVEFHTR